MAIVTRTLVGTLSDDGGRIPLGQLNAVNAWRQRWGLPDVTSVGVHDPSGRVRTTERSARRADAAIALTRSGQALKILGLLSGNPVLRKIGMVLGKIGKRVAEDAAELMEGFGEETVKAMAAELAHLFVVRRLLARQRIIAVGLPGSTIALPTGEKIVQARAPGPPYLIDEWAWNAQFLPMIEHPVIARVQDAGVWVGPAGLASRLRNAFDPIEVLRNLAMESRQRRRAELEADDPEAFAALVRAERVRSLPFVVRNRLHRPAIAALLARDSELRDEQARRRGSWSRKVTNDRIEQAAANIRAQLREEGPTPIARMRETIGDPNAKIAAELAANIELIRLAQVAQETAPGPPPPPQTGTAVPVPTGPAGPGASV